MADLDKIRARLKALRNKTVANGCTEDEAMAAAEKYAELLSSYNIDAAELDALDYDEVEIEIGRRSPLTAVYHAVAAFADCKGWIVTRERRTYYCFFGRSTDVVVAEYVYEVMRGAAKRALSAFRLSNTYKRRRTPKTRAAAVRAFLEALAAVLRRKIAEGLYRRYFARHGEGASDALILSRASLTAEAERRGHRFTTMRGIQKAGGKFAYEAHAQGFAAGAKIDVNAGVAAGNKVAGLLS